MKKQELIEKLEAKGMTVDEIAGAIQFDPMILGLYLAKDEYPIPKRILQKLEEVAAN